MKISWIDIALVILFIMAVYFIISRILGYSATDLTIGVTLFTFLGGLVYKLNREFGEFKVEVRNAFKELKKK